jgi:hypothetical protein
MNAVYRPERRFKCHRRYYLIYNLNVGSLFHHWSDLRRESEQIRIDFIRADLDVCLTFAAIVESEYNMGNREHAERTLAETEKGYSDMLRFFALAKGLTPEVEKELQSKFKYVRERLDGLQRLR